MGLDTPTANPETAEILAEISSLLSEKKDGNYTSNEGTCFIWTTGIRLGTPGRTVLLKRNGLYDSFQLNIQGGALTLSTNSIASECILPVNRFEPSKAALSALKVLLAALKTAEPSTEVSIFTASMEDRVQQMLKEEGKPPYGDKSGIAGQFYRRP